MDMDERPHPARRGVFFPIYATVLLAFVLLGFSRTLYLRPWFTDEPLPALLFVHGIVLTAWFAFFLSQTLLVARGRLVTHRRMGMLGGALATLVLVTALLVVLGIVGRWRSLGVDVEAERGQISLIVWGDLGALLAFAVFTTRGVLERNVAAAHKRLMLLGSLSLMAPAFIRVSAIPPFDQFGGVLFTLVALLLLAGALLAHDVWTLRRVHRETLWGLPLFFVLLLGGSFAMPGTAVDAWLMSRLW